MIDKPIVLKLGGSVITDKNIPLTPNLNAIERLADEISQAQISSLILVHGGGSFGHPFAKQYNLTSGYNDPSQVIGFSKTHHAMTKLNSMIMEALINHNINAVSVPPSSFLITKNGRMQNRELKIIKKMLKIGLTPVLYGDVVLDLDKGVSILSGDQLVSSLAIDLHASRIIMGGDVEGLFTADPKTDSSAKFIQHITLEELQTKKHQIEGSKVTDVTGGMLGKITELIPAIDRGIPTTIVNATKSTRVYKALRNEDVIRTIIKKR